MIQIIDKIKDSISECARKKTMFQMPSFDRTDLKVFKTELASTGSVLYHCEYKINFDNGDWILLDYVSKDKCRSFQINPDRSVVNVTCSNPTLNFTDGWDEGI